MILSEKHALRKKKITTRQAALSSGWATGSIPSPTHIAHVETPLLPLPYRSHEANTGKKRTHKPSPLKQEEEKMRSGFPPHLPEEPPHTPAPRRFLAPRHHCHCEPGQAARRAAKTITGQGENQTRSFLIGISDFCFKRDLHTSKKMRDN